MNSGRNTLYDTVHNVVITSIVISKMVSNSVVSRTFFENKCSHFYLLFQLFYSFFKSLVGKEVIVELKNDLRYRKVLLIMYKFN